MPVFERRSNFFIIAATSVILLLATTNAFAVLLKGIGVSQRADDTSVVSLELSGIPISSFHTLSKTDKETARCYVDLFSTVRSELVPANMKLGDGNVATVRTGLHGNTVRVVLDLEDGVQCTRALDQTRHSILLLAGRGDTQEAPTDKKGITHPEQAVASAAESSLKHQMEQQNPIEQQDALDFQQSAFTNKFAGNLQNSTPFKLWGWVKAYGAYDLEEDDYEDSYYARTRGRLGFNWDHAMGSGGSLSTTLSADVDHIFYDNDRADEDTDAAIYESYVNLAQGNFNIAIGKQRIRWGKGDQVSPLDMLNPEDLRQSISAPIDEMKIPSWLLRVRYFFPKFTVDTVFEPWMQRSLIDYFDSDWALYRNLRQSILYTPYISNDLKNFTSGINIHEDQPGKSLENASFAMRVSWQTDQSDYAISGRYGWENSPTITGFPVTNFSYAGQSGRRLLEDLSSAILTSDSIESTYMRQKTIGFEWETILEPIGFRGEIVYIDSVSYLNDALTSSRKPVSYVIVGADYTTLNDWYFNIQLAWQKIYGYNSNILYFARDNVLFLGEIRKPLWRGNLEVFTRFTNILTDQSFYIQPGVRLKYFEDTEIETGVMLFTGEDDTIIGSYDNADQVYLQGKYFF